MSNNNLFSTKVQVLFGDTILTSPYGDGTAILCGQVLYRLSNPVVVTKGAQATNPVAVTKGAQATNPAGVKEGAQVASESSLN